jgi:enamine deaminase RidA (YjgF/YER057c/UK114 family)
MLKVEERPAALAVSEAGGGLVLATWTWRAGARSATEAAEEAYAALEAALGERAAYPVQERVFGDLAAAPCVAKGRARAVGPSAERWAVPATFVEGSPVGREGVAGIHVIAAPGAARIVAEGDRIYGRLVVGPTARLLGLTDVGRRASGRLMAGPAEEAAAAIDAAEQLLGREGFSFRDAARTWFFLRDILDWYGPFNAVRNAAYRRIGLIGSDGVRWVPASTGIAGRNARGGWCTLDLLALRSHDGGRAEMRGLRSPRQSEATEYGSAFARAIELTLDDARCVFVSGTAAIDGNGATVHVGDFEAQTIYTLENVQALLEGVGAGLGDVRQASAFLKDPRDGRAFERIVARCGMDAVPLVTTVADVCRPELLFEIDATAVVPLARGPGR